MARVEQDSRSVIAEIGKACSACGKQKPSEAFGRDRYAGDGKTSACKDCRYSARTVWSVRNHGAATRASRNWYWRNKKRIREAHSLWLKKNPEYAFYRTRLYSRRVAAARLWAVRALGGKCANCGYKDRRALQIDHIHGDGAAERASGFGRGSVPFWRRVLDIGSARYQVLCANCNWIKRLENHEVRGRYLSPMVGQNGG